MKTIIVKSDEIERTINFYSKGKKHIRFNVFVRPWLPTTDDLGFIGCVIVPVSKKTFIKCCHDSLIFFTIRGASLSMKVPEKDFGSFSI